MQLYGADRQTVLYPVTVIFVRQNWLLPYNFKNQLHADLHGSVYGEI
jgi:hypothetical protein